MLLRIFAASILISLTFASPVFSQSALDFLKKQFQKGESSKQEKSKTPQTTEELPPPPAEKGSSDIPLVGPLQNESKTPNSIPLLPVQDSRKSQRNIPIDQSKFPSPKRVAKSDFFGGDITGPKKGQLGVKLKSVKKGTPAEIAGLRKNDRIVTVGGSPIASADDFNGLLQVLSPGDRTEVEFIRDRKRTKTMVRFGDTTPDPDFENGEILDPSDVENSKPKYVVDDESAPPSDDPNMIPEPEPSLANRSSKGSTKSKSKKSVLKKKTTSNRAYLGMTVVNHLSESKRLFQKLRSGARVDSVLANSPAEKASIPVGAVVVAANGRRVDSSSDLTEYVKKMKPGDDLALTFYEGFRLRRVSLQLGTKEEKKPTKAQPRQPRQATNSQIPPFDDPRFGPTNVPTPAKPITSLGTPKTDEENRLKRVIDTQQQQIDALMRRLNELENRVGSGKGK